MSSINARASPTSRVGPVYEGSISVSGKSEVLKCDTEEPGCWMEGAYISTWPLGWRSEVKIVPSATTLGPTQCRSPASVLAVRAPR